MEKFSRKNGAKIVIVPAGWAATDTVSRTNFVNINKKTIEKKINKEQVKLLYEIPIETRVMVKYNNINRNSY